MKKLTVEAIQKRMELFFAESTEIVLYSKQVRNETKQIENRLNKFFVEPTEIALQSELIRNELVQLHSRLRQLHNELEQKKNQVRNFNTRMLKYCTEVESEVAQGGCDHHVVDKFIALNKFKKTVLKVFDQIN